MCLFVRPSIHPFINSSFCLFVLSINGHARQAEQAPARSVGLSLERLIVSDQICKHYYHVDLQ